MDPQSEYPDNVNLCICFDVTPDSRRLIWRTIFQCKRIRAIWGDMFDSAVTPAICDEMTRPSNKVEKISYYEVVLGKEADLLLETAPKTETTFVFPKQRYDHQEMKWLNKLASVSF